MLDERAVGVFEREVALNDDRAVLAGDDADGALKSVFHSDHLPGMCGREARRAGMVPREALLSSVEVTEES